MERIVVERIEYEITRKIADGGMGAVYEALQGGVAGFHKRVAIKTLLPEFMHDSDFVLMLVNEAKLVSNLVHENIVQIYQLAQHEEMLFMVLEYVNGISLQTLINFHRVHNLVIPENLAVFIASRIARALSYAHTRRDEEGNPLGIVHRDVSPNNILITTEGLPKLADFGVAIATNLVSGRTGWTQVGKYVYVCPQQFLRKPVDFRSDIFSLGAVLFELLSLTPIRSANSSLEYEELAAIGFVDWENFPAEVPAELREILLGCLAKSVDDRYASTDHLAKELEYYIYRHGYGPTIQTLEAYMRDHIPQMYRY